MRDHGFPLRSFDLLDAIQDAVAVLDKERRFIYANRAMAEFLGLPVDQILGETCHSLVHGGIDPVPGCPFFRAATTDSREAIELENPGKGTWLKVSVDPLRDAQGRFAGAVHIITDITETKRAERKAAEESGLLRSLLDNSSGVMYRGLRDWSLTFIAAEVKRLTGHSAPEFLCGAVNWKNVIHPDDLETVRALFRQAVAERRDILRVEYRIRRAEGATSWISDRRRLFYDEGGHFQYVDGLLLDISGRKKGEESLQATTDKLQALIETSPLPIMAIDPDGMVTLWNPAAERVFGWTAGEAIGRFNPIVPDDRLDEFNSNRERVIREGGFSGLELRRRRKDGALIDISLSTAPLRNGGGAITGIMAVVADITERKRIEEELRRSQEQFRQAQKMEAVGRLAGGVAHDFNNLLTAICGYTDLMLLQIDERSPLRREVEEIQKAGGRAADLTQQLLAFSRKQVLQPRVVDLNAIVANLDKMMRRLIGEDVDLITVLRPGIGMVKVDPGQIEQVLMNLVVNARDAMPGGGKITVETTDVDLSAAYASRHTAVRPGPHVMLAVTDTGIGMDEDTKSHLFDPFFTTKGKGKGTGLGLSTVYGIVKQSNGSIWVYSEPGTGTTFKIYFPRCDAHEPDAMVTQHPGSAPRGRETILLVEDDEVVRALAREVLQGNGYTVLEAGNGEEALRICNARRNFIELMITDVVMPRMGGRQLVDEIPGHLAGMKILYMSGYPDEAIGQHGLLDPGTPFLQKPFTLAGLLCKVRETLDG